MIMKLQMADEHGSVNDASMYRHELPTLPQLYQFMVKQNLVANIPFGIVMR